MYHLSKVELDKMDEERRLENLETGTFPPDIPLKPPATESSQQEEIVEQTSETKV